MTEKREIQLMFLESIGDEIEALKEAAQDHLALLGGSAQGAKACCEQMQGLLGLVDRENDEGMLSDDERALIKPWIKQAALRCERVFNRAAEQIGRAHGEVSGLSRAVAALAKRRGNLETLQARERDGALAPGGQLGHPGMTLKEQRLAEAAAEASAASGGEIIDREVPEEKAAMPEEKVPAKKTATRRRKKTTTKK